jgi:hypothetical protein
MKNSGLGSLERCRVASVLVARVHGLSVPAVIALVVKVLAGCGWSQAQPTLVLEVRHVARGRRTEEAFARAQAVAFTAAVSMAVERAAAWPMDALRNAELRGGFDMGAGTSSDVGAHDAESAPPYPPPQIESVAGSASEWSSTGPATALELSDGSERAGLGCDAPALCSWARSSEESAFAAAVSWLRLDP